MSEMSNVYILILDAFKSEKKKTIKVEKSAILISLVSCCSEKEIRLFGQDLLYPEACWPISPVAWSLLSPLLTKASCNREQHMLQPIVTAKGASRHQPANICHQLPSQEQKQMLGASPLWTLTWQEDGCISEQKIIAEDKNPCSVSQRANYSLTLTGRLRNAINYFKIITRPIWNTQIAARLKTDLNLWN